VSIRIEASPTCATNAPCGVAAAGLASGTSLAKAGAAAEPTRPGGTAESASPTRTPPRLRPRLARPRASPDRPNARALPQTAPGPPNCVVFACPRHRRHELHGAKWGWRTGYEVLDPALTLLRSQRPRGGVIRA